MEEASIGDRAAAAPFLPSADGLDGGADAELVALTGGLGFGILLVGSGAVEAPLPSGARN
jgi:hypothetical protein